MHFFLEDYKKTNNFPFEQEISFKYNNKVMQKTIKKKAVKMSTVN